MMGRDVVPVDPLAIGLKKAKGANSRSWILLDSSGQDTILDVDKYAIMHRVQIHARDLRIFDPLLSYPSTILGREKAIVINLEHLKVIITADEIIVRRRAVECGDVPILLGVAELGIERAIEILGLLSKCIEGIVELGKYNCVKILVNAIKEGSSRCVLKLWIFEMKLVNFGR